MGQITVPQMTPQQYKETSGKYKLNSDPLPQQCRPKRSIDWIFFWRMKGEGTYTPSMGNIDVKTGIITFDNRFAMKAGEYLLFRDTWFVAGMEFPASS
jgi:hypothetical protein